MRLLPAVALLCAALPAVVTAGPAKDPIAAATARLQRLDGFLPLYWDKAKGRLLVETTPGREMIYVESLSGGVGSNPLGLDRGEMGPSRLVRFDRVGPRLLLVQANPRYRARTEDASQRRAVAESFAESVLWGGKVEAESGDRVLADATDLFLSDIHRVALRLKEAKQGTYALDKDRSAIDLAHTRAFPRNTEVEAILTLTTGETPGTLVDSVAPSAASVTVREHHSFVALPEAGYAPRRADPRVGVASLVFNDYASPFTEPIETRWIARHRLQKQDPAAPVSPAVQPIVYYVDPGIPEPIRGAVLEGVGWWKQAFEAAGFKDAFKVLLLPADADPMDARYNIVQWVHRSTRGWSYGGSVFDPRTGEIVKGAVRLGSLRIRQDVLLARGLVPEFEEPAAPGSGRASAMALARIRQLAAHEVGHTLGLDHNMAASTSERASVMDYPAPRVRVVDGRLDLSDAYGTGVGAYDVFAIRYAYSQPAPGADEDAHLDRIVRCALAEASCPAPERAAQPLLFVQDSDSRPVSAAHPRGAVWDDGTEAVAGLRHEMEVRRIALAQFGLGNLPPGQPVSSLEDMLLPLYLHHRYQLEAAAKSLGGIDYTYAVRERDGVVPSPVRRVVAPERQREALAAILDCLDPAFLALPQRLLDVLAPVAYGWDDSTAERFERRTTPAFDPRVAALVGSDVAVSALLDPRRDARLVQHHAEDAANPGLDEVLGALVARADDGGAAGLPALAARARRDVVVERLIGLASSADVDAQVRALAIAALRDLSARLARSADADAVELAHRHAVHDDIERFLAHPEAPAARPALPAVPPGPPIG